MHKTQPIRQCNENINFTFHDIHVALALTSLKEVHKYVRVKLYLSISIKDYYLYIYYLYILPLD